MEVLAYRRGEYSCLEANASTCVYTVQLSAYRDGLAILRILLSTLSVLGAASIVFSAVARRQLFNPQVHPIFMLAIADCVLALAWITGGVLWMHYPNNNRVWCFTASLVTVIVECVSMNLTLVYAFLAYSTIRQCEEIGANNGGWHQLKVITSYFIAWFLPTVLVMVPFGAIAGEYRIVEKASNCSCWCMPTFGNVLPLTSLVKQDPGRYMYSLDIERLVLTYGVILATHYLVGFVTLVILYYKVFQLLKQLKRQQEGTYSRAVLLRHGRASDVNEEMKLRFTRAQKRVVIFITVFLISGFFNFVLSLIMIAHKSKEIRQFDIDNDPEDYEKLEHDVNVVLFDSWIYYLQSITVTLQGFLNAIVYGWTREDFLHAMNVPLRDIDVEVETEAISEDSGKKRVDNSGSIALELTSSGHAHSRNCTTLDEYTPVMIR